MEMKINGEEIFATAKDSFGVSPASAPYTLAYSMDGKTFTNWTEQVPAGEPLIVNGCPYGMYIKLVGNAEELTVLL